MASHPRPQIASDLGRNVTRSFNPHRNRNQFPSGNKILAYGRRFKSQPASTRCDLRIASPTRPFPDPPFLAFLEKARKTTKKNKDFFTMPNPSNPWERREKRAKKARKFLATKKARKSKKQGKEDQGFYR